MSETRSPDELVDAIVALQAKLADLESTLTVRVATRPTGDIESTIRNSPKTGTLILNGQLVARATYPVLWQFAQDEGLVIAGLFTVGDGSTTFGLPDFRGRTIMGVGTGAGDTYTLGEVGGSLTTLLTTAMMPVHNHGSAGDHGHGGSGFTNTVGSHGHGGSGFTNSVGDHGAHVSASNVNHNSGTGANGSHGHTPSWGANWGGHNHTVDLGGSAGSHNHTVDLGGNAGSHTHANNGGTTPVPVTSPYIAVNWLIYV